MADISRITLPSGSVYNIKDATARQDISELRTSLSGAAHYIDVTTTPLTDNCETNPITIGGESYTAKAGDVVAYGNSEFIFSALGKWREFGSTGSLKSLAFKDSASGNYTPAGSVSKPTFTGTEGNLSVKGTPKGNVSIAIGTGTANYTPAGSVSQPSFSGTEGNISVSGTPTGNVSISVGTGTANYTPAGSVSQPTTTVELNTTTVNSITDVGSLPSCTLPTYTVNNEVLSISSGSFDAGTLPTKGSDTEVATSVNSVVTSKPTFTGTGAELKATFTGTSLTSTGKFTPNGSVSKPTFTGTGTQLKATFTGTETTSTGKFTPNGSVSKPTFTGTGTQLKATFTGTETTSTGKFTPNGSVSKPTFTGTQDTISVS